MRNIRVAGLLVVFILLLGACAYEPVTSQSSQLAPVQSASAVSRALGMSREAWENMRGPGITATSHSSFYPIDWDDHASVFYSNETSESPSFIIAIDIRLPVDGPSLEDARDASMKLLPSDAILVGNSTRAASGRTVLTDHLTSEALRRMSAASCKERSVSKNELGNAFISYAIDSPTGRLSMVSISWACPQ
jgi:hypothetical protein